MAASARYRAFLDRLEATRTLGVDFGLERMAAALAKLGSPEKQVPAVHVAGTNGKGSTSAMTEAILRAAGRRTGLFTSPHLSRFTERIRCLGQEIDQDVVAECGARVFATGVPLTYFEVATAIAFVAFAEAKVDVGIIEVGLGGRLDATNLCAPIATAITSIGYDHMELLGDSLFAIAREKAGIAKRGVPLYLAAVPEEARRAITEVSAQVGADVVPVAAVERKDLSALSGAHQASNAALAVALARLVAEVQKFSLSEETIAAGLGNVTWPGRLEWVAPDVLLDAAHNADGARALRAALDLQPATRLPRALVLSIVAGKAADEMVATLAPAFDLIYVTRSSSPRALTATALAEIVAPLSDGRLHVVEDAWKALEAARGAVAAGGFVVVAGSIFLLGDLRARLCGEEVDPVATSDPYHPKALPTQFPAQSPPTSPHNPR